MHPPILNKSASIFFSSTSLPVFCYLMSSHLKHRSYISTNVSCLEPFNDFIRLLGLPKTFMSCLGYLFQGNLFRGKLFNAMLEVNVQWRETVLFVQRQESHRHQSTYCSKIRSHQDPGQKLSSLIPNFEEKQPKCYPPMANNNCCCALALTTTFTLTGCGIAWVETLEGKTTNSKREAMCYRLNTRVRHHQFNHPCPYAGTKSRCVCVMQMIIILLTEHFGFVGIHYRVS